MNLKEWRAKQQAGEKVTIPSGLEVQIRLYGIVDLVLDGKLPAEMEPVVNEILENGIDVNVTTLPQINRLMLLMLGEVLLGPDGLEAEELPASDRQWLFQYVIEATTAEQVQGVVAAPGGDGVQPEAV